jgi:membrane protease YdiL (CAAX protease family)
MLNQHKTLKYAWIFYPLVFLIFIWPYGIAPFSWPIDVFSWLGAWRFVLVTPVLIAITAWFFRKNWANVLGFPTRIKQLVACAIVGIAGFLVFHFFINFVLRDGGYRILPPDNGDYLSFFGSFPIICRTLWRICQPLNEEIVLRALLLGFFARYFNHRAYLAILSALVFSLLHWLLYYYGVLAVKLELSTLLTLFFFALAANALYLTFGHIGFGFVIHMTWNWWRFSGNIIRGDIILNEPQTFNALEGSAPVFLLVSILSLACIIGLVIHDGKMKGMKGRQI